MALAELQTRADTGSWYTQCVLTKVLAARGGDDAITELRALVLTGGGGPELLSAYRKRTADRHVSELDCEARPVYNDWP